MVALEDSCGLPTSVQTVKVATKAADTFVLQDMTCVAAVLPGGMTYFDLDEDITGTLPLVKDFVE